jgi:hypothetical protein
LNSNENLEDDEIESYKWNATIYSGVWGCFTAGDIYEYFEDAIKKFPEEIAKGWLEYRVNKKKEAEKYPDHD